MIDSLIEKIVKLNNPSVIGLDTSFDYLPENIKKSCKNFSDIGKAILEFNNELIETLYKYIPAVKVQVAYYEMYGVDGMIAFNETMKLAKNKKLTVIADIKRNDIGATAACYSKAYLGGVVINGKSFTGFDCDAVTINGYLGVDGIEPFVNDCKTNDKGMFVLVKTSNQSSGQLQDRILEDKTTVYEAMGKLVKDWGKDTIGTYGYSEVGAVVGATYSVQAQKLRSQMPNTFFLVPGYGAQGGAADELTVCFDNFGLGAIVNSSRGIICAYKQDKYKGMTYQEASLAATMDMQNDIYSALKKAGKVK